MWLLERTDQGGGFLTVSGSEYAYTKDIRKAEIWPTKEAAERYSCPENEVAVSLKSLLEGLRRFNTT